MFCRNCGEIMTDTEVVCHQCGFALDTGLNYCEQCGSPTPAYDVVCEVCGKSINRAETNMDGAAAQYAEMPQPSFQTQSAPQYQDMPQSVYPIPPEQQQPMQSVYPIPSQGSFNGKVMGISQAKSKKTATVLGFLFGWCGVHDFYLGNTVAGFVHLGMSICGMGGISWVWAIVQTIATMNDPNATDANNNPLE